MSRCESIGCPDEAAVACSFYDWDGNWQQGVKLCLPHSDQHMRHSAIRICALLYSVSFSDLQNAEAWA